MADRIIAHDPMKETEKRLGLRPVEELLAERYALVEKAADLKARYGAFGTMDHLRKMELARLAGLVRAQAMRDKIKMTAAEVEDATHDHPDYRSLITTATKERAEWCRLEAQIEAVDWVIRRGQTVASYLGSEARL